MVEHGRELLSAAQREALDRAFEIGFFEAVLRTEPDHLEALAALGHLYTEAGRYRAGLEVDRRLVKLLPHDPIVRYNLACSLALIGEREAAIAELERAVALGYDEAEHMERDPDLTNLRELAAFQSLLERVRARAQRARRGRTGGEARG